RGTAHPDEAEEIVEIRQPLVAEVGGKITGKAPVAENLGGASAERAAVDLHLPEALLRVQISLREKEVAYVLCINVWNAVPCPGNSYFGLKSGERNLAGVPRRAGAQPAAQ